MGRETLNSCPSAAFQGGIMSKKRKTEKIKTVLDPWDLMNLGLDRFFEDAVRERGLLKLLESLGKACASRSEHYQKELEKGPRPGLRVRYQDEVEFFNDAALEIFEALESLKQVWKGREMPTSADGEFRGFSKRMADAEQAYLESLVTKLANPDATAEDWSTAAAVLAKEGKGMIWINNETGAPDFNLARSFKETTAKLIDPNVPQEEKRGAAEVLRDFITANGERRAHA
jgi:hypothetical protein